MSIKPIGKWIALEELPEVIESASGLKFSGEAKEKLPYRMAKVIMPGTEVAEIKEGDTLYFSKYNSFTMFIDGSEVTFAQERDILAVVT